MEVGATEFVFPTDDEYLRLKSQYSFHENDLDSHFTAFARDTVGELMALAKQHNLLRFRELLLLTSETPPNLLFTYVPGRTQSNPALSEISGLQTFAIAKILSWPDEPAQYVLADEIQKVYPGSISWAFRYFVMVPFPAAFGHFLSHEYLDGGLRFIHSHIAQQDTVIELVGSYLLHAFLFRDRLLDTFCDQLAGNQSTLTEDSFLEAFITAFGLCIRYFTPHHIEAVKLLVTQHGTRAALKSLTSFFLCVIVQLWQFSPLLAGLPLAQSAAGHPLTASLEEGTFSRTAWCNSPGGRARTGFSNCCSIRRRRRCQHSRQSSRQPSSEFASICRSSMKSSSSNFPSS
jgi:hypothetical protein